MKKTKLILILAVLVIAALLTGCPDPPTTTITVEKVTFTPDAGIYNYDQTVTLSCSTEGAAIYYTLDGNTPTAESTLYVNPINVTGHNTVTNIKAIAISEATASEENTGSYSIDYSVYPAMTGSITTGGGVDINQIKVGLFFKGHASGPNSTTNLSLSDDVDTTSPSGRIYHNDSEITDGDAVSISPNRLGSINTTASTYAIPLPLTTPARSGTDWSEGYYALAWYDTDGDGNLDLKDGAVTTYADQGEYNRMPVKSVELNGNANTSCFVDFIEQNELDADGYQFKYYNVTDDNDYDHIALTNTTMGDFNFTIDAVTDTN